MAAVRKTARGIMPPDDAPLRGDLLGAERLEDAARVLAASQRWSAEEPTRATPLHALLERAEGDLKAAYRTLATDVREDIPLSPAAEWLLDNFYLIEEQIRIARDDLPSDYSAELPRLLAGSLQDYPRVFEAAAELVVHTDARIDREHLVRYIMAFQDVSPLTIAEVWAVPIMLRICLVENVRRLARRVLAFHQAGVAADRWVDRLLRAANEHPSELDSLIAEIDRAHASAPPHFLVRLSQRQRGQDSALESLSDWLEATLAKTDVPLEQLTLEAHQHQAAEQVSVANTITSIRFLGSLEWREFFEDCSLVEHVLREDPAGVYHRMDFTSRDRYRHSIETLARQSPLSEIEVAEAAISHAIDAIGGSRPGHAEGHVGHYLISDGRYALERSIDYRPRFKEHLYRGPLASRGRVYWGLLGATTIVLAGSLGAYVLGRGADALAAGLLIALALVPVSDLALNITNRLMAWLWPPRMLPKLDYGHPIADAHRTMVVYAALLTSSDAARHVIDNLEIGHLANTDPNVHFAVLADLKGADADRVPGDEDIIETARRGIETLNERYGSSGSRPFHLFIRGRRYNEHEGQWMGWERKRGALEELSRLMRGATDTSFLVAHGDPSILASVTFVVTLDTDTVLPRDGARKLVSTIAHPLNRAQYDPGKRLVTAGYGLVQPRVGMSLAGAERSTFAWLYSGVTGIDPYAGAVSDTYQDVFGEGSYTGKGIFEVDVYNAVLADRFPADSLLSHDLLEGSYLRTGLASDVEVLDEQPASYISHCARLHRWVRGDWQTLPWLLPVVPTATGRERNPLRTLHRWKIADNLRRSVFAPSMIVLVAAGWAVLPGAQWGWLAILLTITLFPVYFSVADSLLFRPAGADVRGDPSSLREDLKRDTIRALLSLAVLPHQAYLMLDSIVRALWRMAITRQGLLEWETAAEAERRLSSSGAAAFFRRMWPGYLVALAAIVPALALNPEPLGAALSALPLLALWAAAPRAAWYVSLPTRTEPTPIDERDVAMMRRIARKTWRFFETFVTAEDHWLAPDNYQEDPKGEIAHRTSPTNMGLQLLAALAAYDFGYVSLGELVSRVSQTLHTMAGLERFRGHFYNWYDTRTLQPLRPTYVSTVDSGNLAGHLLVLRVGLLEASESPLVSDHALTGLADTTGLALEELVGARARLEPGGLAELRTSLEELLRRLDLDEPPRSLADWSTTLRALAPVAEALPGLAARLTAGRTEDAGAVDRVREAVDTVAAEFAQHLGDLARFTPWADELAGVPRAVLDGPDAAPLAPLFKHVPSLVGLAEGLELALEALDRIAAGDGESASWASRVASAIRGARPECVRLLAELRLSADIAREMWEHTDFAMLFDRSRKVFSIGYNTAEGRLDNSFYDMLASECRLASFLAIAKGDVPQEHWFRLGRAITQTEGGRALVSWSASMFEYLMPLLVMRSWPGTLLDQTYRSVVKRQIAYGRQRGVPWGVSESAFNAKDVELTYQYQAFGVPGLGLKRGLSEDVVIAPYATALAVMVDPRAALDNLAALSKHGGEGRYGYFEAIDYTPGRVPAGKERAIVQAYMAHHQGMSLVALANALSGNRMQERFHADPIVSSTELLLQERVPRRVQLAQPRVEEVEFVRSVREVPPPVARAYPGADTAVPSTHFLSNGSYSVMVTNAGGGYSRWHDREVTRHREDITRDWWGMFFYLRDVDSGRVWSATHQPTLTEADEYHVTFSADKAEYRRIDGAIETHTEVVVSPEDDVEVRRLTIGNHGREPVTIEVTSYFEITLAPRGADHAHKAFSNLFVETEALRESGAVLFTRRPRSSEEPRCWGMHVVACELGEVCEWSCETDRARFLGRLRSPALPAAVAEGGPLSDTTGAVLDPACAIRRTVTIGPGESARLAFCTGAAESREGVVGLAERYRDIRSAQRAADLAWSTSQIELRDLGITPEEAVTFQRLASRLLLTDAYSPLKVHTEVENRLPISGLWQLGISGDDPMLLLKIERLEETPLVRQALLAHQYWRTNGFVVDLVILNTKPSAYASDLDGKLRMLLRTGLALQLVDRPGGVHLRTADQVQPDVLNLIESVARVVLTGDGGPLAIQLNRRATYPELPDPFVATRTPERFPPAPRARPKLSFDNGHGGFDLDEHEYVIVLESGETTPLPWVNVMANSRFGALVSEAGIGCTWAENSHENRITTWNNDPVSDGTGECIYLRDEETGEFWSPTPLPCRSEEPYVVRHGRGYSRFEHEGHGLRHSLDWFVAADDPLRVVRLRLANTGERARELSVTQFIEWSLGDSRSKAQQRVVTWWDADARMLMAHSWFNLDFPGRPAFLACDCSVDSFTASRTEFIGRNRAPQRPAAMERRALGGTCGRFHDNCGALMKRIRLEPGETAEIAFFLGQTETVEAAHELVGRYRAEGAVDAALAAVRASWDAVLDTVEAETPNATLDAIVNGPLLYQALACRFWGRTATYQSSGAFGFRDQLQDCLALLYVRPDLVREHIIEASRRQFPEGDVLHWWQPISGRGVRTRFSDDRHWLPYVVAEYVRATGDVSVLDVETPYLEGPPVPEGREDLYLQPNLSLRVATVYEHCLAALDAGTGLGVHELPLMGGGDWNDGMNRVGIGGRGESVWLAWFLDVTLRAFAPIAEVRGDDGRADELRARARALVDAIERSSWDGAWYRRAYFDDGTPLGSKQSPECRIDAIAQAWSVISGQGDPDRARRAMESVEEQLVRWEEGLIKLLTPPFDQMEHDPGYIKGYVPGVRENGGQYTHAALWVASAYAMLGDGDEAASLLGLLNPINHALTAEGVARYRVEPYVVAADVYAVDPHIGRGGWTWYTGSASWFYRIVVRDVLGLRLEAEPDGPRFLVMDPCIPKSWSSYRLTYRHGETTYRIEVANPRGVNRGVEAVELDGFEVADSRVPLLDDGAEHLVRVRMLGG